MPHAEPADGGHHGNGGGRKAADDLTAHKGCVGGREGPRCQAGWRPRHSAFQSSPQGGARRASDPR
jgi:hypothetical protein